MAIDDNTSYELYGSQVKDLANRIKRNTAWAKDLAGGETRAVKQINMVKLSADDADLIAAQTGESSATILQTMVYGFFDVATERWLNKDELGAAIYASTAEIVYFHDYKEDVDEYPKVTYYESGFDAGNNTYYPVIWLNVHKTNDAFGDGILREVTLGNNSAGLVDWYTPSETTLDLKVDCIIQYIDNATAQTIADEINAANPGASVTSYDVSTYMQFIVRSAKTGRYMTTKSGFINALRNTTRSVFKPDKSNTQMSNILVDKYRTSGDGSYFIIRDVLLGKQSTYCVKTANASYGTNAEYMWYIIEQDTISETQDAWGSYDNTATSYAANSTYQLAYDSSDNLYMAANTNSASDWKQINNDAITSTLATVATSGSYNDLSDKPTIPTVNDGTLTIQQNGTTVGTFTANQSSAATVSLTDTTYSVMTGATSSTAGASGLVPAPAAGDEAKVLSGAGTWVNQSGGSTYTAGNGISISANNEISIDGVTVRKMEPIYKYVQQNNTSSTTTYDIPIDLTIYKYLEVSVQYYCGSGSSSWTLIQALDSSKNTINFRQCGIEASNSTTLSGINRDHSQIVATECQSGYPTSFDLRIHVGGDSNPIMVFSRSFGGNNTWQVMQSRSSSGASSIKYLRIPLVAPRAGAHITVWGAKGTDMGY